MAKKKKRARKQKMVSRAINFGLTLLTFARPISLFLGAAQRGMPATVAQIVNEATFGLVNIEGGQGSFDLQKGLLMYAPAGAAFGLHEMKKFASKHFPTR